ncbi:FliH/SctL family protein [Roseicyclus sp.]|uniref:FliH/SctL family protein n=1 Tax=Roseicyclus sp. TaxID=1914329 RepID=UPI003F6BDF0B
MNPSPTSPEATLSDTAPLDETEITRLIAAARTETYRPSQAVPQGKTDAFRPKSLLELAQKQREADKAAARADVPMPDAPNNSVKAPAHPAEDDDGTYQAVLPEDEGDFAVQARNTPAGTRQLPSGTAEGLMADDGDDEDGMVWADQDATGQEFAALSTTDEPAIAADTGPSIDPGTLEQVRAEAFSAGRAEAEAELRDGLSMATQVLEAVAQALSHPAADALAGLRADIAEAVLRLASERAGLEIDTMPDAFLERIEALADRIHAQASQPILRLHPDDLAAIEALIASSDSLASMRIVTSVELSRGDVDLVVDGLRLSDRILGQPAARKKARSAAKPKADEA